MIFLFPLQKCGQHHVTECIWLRAFGTPPKLAPFGRKLQIHANHYLTLSF